MVPGSDTEGSTKEFGCAGHGEILFGSDWVRAESVAGDARVAGSSARAPMASCFDGGMVGAWAA